MAFLLDEATPSPATAPVMATGFARARGTNLLGRTTSQGESALPPAVILNSSASGDPTGEACGGDGLSGGGEIGLSYNGANAAVSSKMDYSKARRYDNFNSVTARCRPIAIFQVR